MGYKKSKKQHHLLRLQNMVNVEVKGQPDIVHTFWMFAGTALEVDEVSKYEPKHGVYWKKKGIATKYDSFFSIDLLGILRDKEGCVVSRVEKEEVYFNENTTKLASTENEFKELLELWLIEKKIEIDSASLRKTAIRKLIKDLREARIDYNKICLDNPFETDYKLLNATKRYIKFLKEMEVQKGKRLHPSFDPSLWSSKTYNLFKYLYDNYYDNELEGKPTKRKLTNIWFYLNGLGSDYPSYLTKEVYKVFINENYNVEIKNFDKADKYHDTELPRMNDHRIEFENGIK